MILFRITCITKFIYTNFDFCRFLPVFAGYYQLLLLSWQKYLFANKLTNPDIGNNPVEFQNSTLKASDIIQSLLLDT